MQVVLAHRTDPGLVRPTNQDAYSVDLLDPRGNALLLVVADGMGGYEGGEIASRLAVETVRSHVLPAAADWAEQSHLVEGLVGAFQDADRAIIQAQGEQSGMSSMGTTLTAAIIWGERIFIGHVGDSKAILLRNNRATQITTDHTVANELLKSGHLTVKQAALHPQRHVLTRALGMGDGLNVERLELTWREGDTLLLCTDGLSNLVQLPEIQAQANLEGVGPLVDRVVDLANSRGGRDNITVLAARWEG